MLLIASRRSCWYSFQSMPELTKAAWSLIGITPIQIILGVIAYVVRLNHWDAVTPTAVLVASTVAHVAFGALTMAASVAL